jgi:hypothetical protein
MNHRQGGSRQTSAIESGRQILGLDPDRDAVRPETGPAGLHPWGRRRMPASSRRRPRDRECGGLAPRKLPKPLQTPSNDSKPNLQNRSNW